MLAIGVDIVTISRMRETLRRSGSIFIDRVFTDREKKDSLDHPDMAVYYAEVFAAKEAVFKTFSTGWEDDMSFLDIEIRKGFNGEPLVIVKGAFLQLLSQKKARGIQISLSWEQDTVVAFAVMQ
jgi:holo-[acyl-carrier protein] synthase